MFDGKNNFKEEIFRQRGNMSPRISSFQKQTLAHSNASERLASLALPQVICFHQTHPTSVVKRCSKSLRTEKNTDTERDQMSLRESACECDHNIVLCYT